MSLTPRTITMPFAFSEGTEILAAPADLVVPGNWNVSNSWKVCLNSNEDVMGDPPVRDVGVQFDPRDNVFLEAVRVNCPFGDGVLTVQPRIEFRVFGFDRSPDGINADWALPHLFLDYAAPWGEWQEVNRFIPAWQPGNMMFPTAKTLAIKTYPVTLKTNGLDEAWNGTVLKMELELKVRHVYPRFG